MHVVRSFTLALVLGACLWAAIPVSHAQVSIGISIDVEPPPLPVYDQPIIPAPGYLWVPGYWAWSDDVDYYWVPGTWVLPPEPGLLWTPGYWAWSDGAYTLYDGYWGPEIGFYGGVNYGFGYTGYGYEGGYWSDGSFFYNTAVNNISNVSITNVYHKTVVVNNTSNVSYNGGRGGTAARPTPEQLTIAKEHHIAATPVQRRHVEAAAKNPALSLARNHGHPSVAATAHPAQFKGPGVIAARPGKPVAPSKPTAPSHALPGFTPERNLKPMPPREGPGTAKERRGFSGAVQSKPLVPRTAKSATPAAPHVTSPPIRGPRGLAAKPFTPQRARPAPPAALHIAPPPAMRRPPPPLPRAFAPQTVRPAAPAAPRFAAPPPMRRPPPAGPRCPPGKPCR
jgi:WXXGXW repeat (2 copies)